MNYNAKKIFAPHEILDVYRWSTNINVFLQEIKVVAPG